MEQSQVGIEIVERIADREGVDPVALDVPLYEVIDPDALESLTNATDDRLPGTNLRVQFSYSGYAVAVDGSGKIRIDEQPGETNQDESVRAASDDS